MASGVELRGDMRIDPSTRRLAYEYTVTGVAPEDVVAVVLRRQEMETGAEGVESPGGWLVEARLSGPGVADVQDELLAEQDLMDALARGEVRLDVFTRQHPFGAARAVLWSVSVGQR